MAAIAIVPTPASQTFPDVRPELENRRQTEEITISTPPSAGTQHQARRDEDIEDPPEENIASLPTQTADRNLGLSVRFVRAYRVVTDTGGRLQYPTRFKALGAIVLGLSLTWVGNYLFQVLPTIEEHQDSPCKYNDSQLTYNAKMLFVYFAWFSIARLSLFVPCIASRVAQVQSRTHGFCRTYLVHLVLRDGPLYIFVVGSLLFWFHLMQSPTCEQRSPELYRTLKLYAIYSCLVSIFCLILAYWHNKLLVDATRDIYAREEIRAPPDTITKLQTCAYDAALFGDEEGKLYPAECAICLLAWEAEDVIKITPCGHAFHEECLGNWLRTARTCALCRHDLTKSCTPRQIGTSSGSRRSARTSSNGGAGNTNEAVRASNLSRAAAEHRHDVETGLSNSNAVTRVEISENRVEENNNMVVSGLEEHSGSASGGPGLADRGVEQRQSSETGGQVTAPAAQP